MRSPPLEPIQAALAAGRLSDALSGLLDVWAATRDPQVAESITTLGEALGPLRPPLPDTTGTAFHAGWIAREVEGHPADVRLLTASIRKGHPGMTLLKQRVQRLHERPPDPRIFDALLQRIWQMAFTDMGPAYSKLLRHHGDPRRIGGLEITSGYAGRPWLAERWNTRLARLDKQLAKIEVHPVSGSEALPEQVQAALSTDPAAWMELAPEATDDVLEDLWEAVLADPDDDAPRLVFADRVAERDETHAVFIHQQIEAAHTPVSEAVHKKLAKTLKKRHADWLGPLSGHVESKGLHFERGFLAAGTAITTSTAQARELGDLPYWRTARALWAKHVEFYDGAGVQGLDCAGTRFFPHPTLERWVPVPGGKALSSGQIRKLARAGSYSFRAIQISATESHAYNLIEHLPGLELPNLEVLVLVGMGIDPNVLPALPGVREIVVGPGCLIEAQILASQPGLERLTVGGTHQLMRSDAGWELTFIEALPSERALNGYMAMENPDRRARMADRMAAAIPGLKQTP